MARAADLRELPASELIERLESAKEELFNLRFQFATGQLDNPMRIKEVRHDLARMLTVLREREIAEAEGRELVVPEDSKKRRRRRERRAEAQAAEAAGGEGEAKDEKKKRSKKSEEES